MKTLVDYGIMQDTVLFLASRFLPEAEREGRYRMEAGFTMEDEPDEELAVFFRPHGPEAPSIAERVFMRASEDPAALTAKDWIPMAFSEEAVTKAMNEQYLAADREFTLQQICDRLESCDIPNSEKYQALRFYIHADHEIVRLQEQLERCCRQVGKYYEKNQERFYKLMAQIDNETLAMLDHTLWGQFTPPKKRYCAITLLSGFQIERRKMKGGIGYVLGQCWQEVLQSKTKSEQVDILLFGKIISEPNRMKLIEYLLENKEITVAEAVDFLKASVTATNYHLNMMHVARMLNTRYEGRKIFYSLRRDYFEAAISLLRGLADQM